MDAFFVYGTREIGFFLIYFCKNFGYFDKMYNFASEKIKLTHEKIIFYIY